MFIGDNLLVFKTIFYMDLLPKKLIVCFTLDDTRWADVFLGYFSADFWEKAAQMYNKNFF